MSERVRVEPSDLAGDSASLVVDGDRGHHLVRVSRVRVGDAVMAFDGRGRQRPAAVARVGRGEVLLAWTGPGAPGVGADRAQVRWIQGLPKGDKMDLIVRQATELGVASIAPVFTARSIPREQPQRWTARLLRWERIAEEASRQCGRADVPTIEVPVGLEALCAGPAGGAVRLTAWEGARASLREAVEQSTPGARFEVLAGPEGGLDAAEVDVARAAGFAPVSLGPRILRAETTAAAVLAAISALRGDLGAGCDVALTEL
ncbi:MAG: 16S rRNA (uracil(1498)-N(3))-methyltransferase [Deltaproteobacteria bacterium]|nr:16S rRNA (uracil(1498)-N(3))-methyltransferase [Myxococcales bacterium]MDP3221062.1 16S rRNA (uracil(1498)-N(3))-methyltransferase [Deltaproteobacteria bacterium]